MFRSSLIAVGAALLCSAASAQQQLPTSRMYPVTSPVKNFGTIDVTTGNWTKPGSAHQKLGNFLTIFNNTCTWQTQGYYAGFDWCEENFDEGRIPGATTGGDTLGQAPVADANTINCIQFSYCTFIGPTLSGGGSYLMDLAFWDNLGGNCVGGIPPLVPGIANTYIPITAGLPGSTALGFQACWLITLDMSNSGMVITADGGNGTYDGTDNTDSFTWMQRQNSTTGALNNNPAGPDGFLISGEPGLNSPGSCSYQIPCGTDVLFGNTCGTGLDAFDASWINVDGVAVGAGLSAHNPGCADAVSQYGFGTNCYFFGGYPTNPFASYWLVLKSDQPPPTGGPRIFCSQTGDPDGQPSVTGCFPSTTVPDTSFATGSVQVTSIPKSGTLGGGSPTFGLFLYNTTTGGQSTFSTDAPPFGTLCLNGTKRTAGTPGGTNEQCGATEGIIFVAHPNWTAGAGDCALTTHDVFWDCSGPQGFKLTLGPIGNDINIQCWMRDNTSTDAGKSVLSNAVHFNLAP